MDLEVNIIIKNFHQEKFLDVIEQASNLIIKDPKNYILWLLIGVSYINIKKFDNAIKVFEQSIKIFPSECELFNNLGVAYQKKENHQKAIENFNNSIQLDSTYQTAFYNKGVSLRSLGDLKNAKKYYSISIEKGNNHIDSFINIGNIYLLEKNYKIALFYFSKALEIDRENTSALNSIGNVYFFQNDFISACSWYKKALKIYPEYVECLDNIGNLYLQNKQPTLAKKYLEKALSIDANYLSAKFNLALLHYLIGEYNFTLRYINEYLEISKSSKNVISFYLQVMKRVCKWDFKGFDDHKELLLSSSHGDDVHPFTLLAVDDDPEFHYKISSLYAEKFVGSSNASHSAAFIKTHKQNEKLRIGYFSGEFHEHPVARLIVRILELHDRKKFEVSAFSYGPETISKLRTRIEDSVDHFYNVSELSDKDLVAMTREKSIDIVIDLTGYTLFSRMSLFSQRLAPIQINFLGYPGTSGAGFIDFIIGDKNLIYSDNRSFFSENVIFMPDQYQPQDDTIILSPNSPTRQDLGLPETEFIFCAINNSYKINAGVFDVWMNILQEVDQSVLWLLESNEWSTENLKKEAQNRKIDPNRLIFAKKVAFETYLEQFRCADLYLDTFIYNAGATASNALYAGLPVLTKPGRGYPARMASSLLRAIDLPELIAHSVEEYKTKAIEVANSPEKLQELKNKLHNNKKSAPLFNSELFTRNLERGLIKAHKMNLKNKKFEDIYL